MFDVKSAIGTYFGDYRLTGTLSPSASNFLFFAEKDASPDRIFLVKRRRDLVLDTQEQQEAFLRRANALKAFRHPFVLPILDAGLDQSTPYVVTEYEKHGSLYDRFQRQPSHILPLEETRALLARVGEALYAAHQEGIMHGNLKAQNIVFNDQHEALLADFFLLAPSLASNTTRHQAIVTPGYNAPELRTNRGKPSQESDQYALGSIAYELFAGQRPFTMNSKSNPYKIYKVRSLIPPHQLNPDLAPSVEQALLKALTQDPAQRYSDIRAFLDALGIMFDIVDQDTHIVHSINKDTPLPPLDGEVTQLATMEVTQPPPTEEPLENATNVPFEQAGVQKIPEHVLDKSLVVRTRQANKKTAFAIILLAFLLFGITGTIYSTFARSQSQPIAKIPGKSTPTTLPDSTKKISRSQMIAVSATSTATSISTATSTATSSPTGAIKATPTDTPIITSVATPTSQPTATSAAVPTIIATTPQKPTCSIAYVTTSDQHGQFVATIAITNTGTTPINGWSLRWTYANDQQIKGIWGATLAQNGASVTLQSLSWDQVIQPGQQASSIGITGIYHDTNNNPGSFTLNGTQCG